MKDEKGFREFLRVLADENRFAIVRMLGERGEICGTDILDEIDITQPTLSHHMKVLCSSGLVRCRKEGRWCHYSIDVASAATLSSFFSELAAAAEAAHHADPEVR